MAAAIAAAELAQLKVALDRIGFEDAAATALVQVCGVELHSHAVSLLLANWIEKACKTLCTRAGNPIAITMIQEQLLLAMRYWVNHEKRLYQPVDAMQFNMIIAMQQLQKMMHLQEEEAQADKGFVAKMPDKF
jgi:hypothetical protein